MTNGMAAFPRQVLALTVSPRDAWDEAATRLAPRAALLWQLGGMAACALLLGARAAGIERASRAFSGSGAALLVDVALAAQLAAYVFYACAGAALAYGLLRPLRPGLSYRPVLGVLTYSTFPLLMAWMFRAAIAWARPVADASSPAGFHALVEAIWDALAVRADLGALWAAPPGLPSALLGALSLFWVWHAVTLWGGLRGSLGCSRAASVAVLVALLAIVASTRLAAQTVGVHWREAVSWSE